MILSLKCSWKSQINESRHYTLSQSVISMHRMCNILQGDRKSSNCLSVEKFQSESNTLSEILSVLTTKTLIGVFLQCPFYQHMAIRRLYFQMLFSNKLECFLLPMSLSFFSIIDAGHAFIYLDASAQLSETRLLKEKLHLSHILSDEKVCHLDIVLKFHPIFLCYPWVTGHAILLSM